MPVPCPSAARRGGGPFFATVGAILSCLLYVGPGIDGDRSHLLRFAKKTDFISGRDVNGCPHPCAHIYALAALSSFPDCGAGAVLGSKNPGFSATGALCLGSQDRRALAAGHHVPAADRK